ncbi:MAG TPA: IS30 family transposase [Acidimicrobiia bacterium]
MAAGVGRETARTWVNERGGIAPRRREWSGRYLSLEERVEIQAGLAAGSSIREIARKLGRSPSTVSRELSRHASYRRSRYSALKADSDAQVNARRPKLRKLACDDRLAAEVSRKLKKRWSPREISERLRMDFPDDPSMRISHEAIYQSLFMLGRGGLRKELTSALRSGRAIRRPRRSVGERRGRIKDKVMISERDAEAEDRAVPGHWEGDLILGKNNASAIGTLVERNTRFTILLYLPGDHTAATVRDAVVARIKTLPVELRKSLAWDQGHEMAQHQQITIDAGINVYFCDPASPWQRGTNENTNGLLRQYFPKGTDLSVFTPEDLQAIEDEFNDRPRAVLGYRKPHEVIAELLLPSPD